MSNTINVTVELCAEDRARLDAILACLSHSVQPTTVTEATEPQVVETHTPAEENPVVAPIVEEAPVVEEPPVEEPKPQPVALAELQKAVTLACSKGAEQKKAVKALINKYAASVSTIPEDKRAEVMAELATI